jgi:hypothetical protein
MSLSEETIEKLKEEHGEVWVIEVDGGQPIAFRCPTRQEFRKFKAMASDEKKKPDADDLLAREVVVYPSKADFDALLNRRPGVSMRVAGAVIEAASGEELKDAKKL